MFLIRLWLLQLRAKKQLSGHQTTVVQVLVLSPWPQASQLESNRVSTASGSRRRARAGCLFNRQFKFPLNSIPGSGIVPPPSSLVWRSFACQGFQRVVW